MAVPAHLVEGGALAEAGDVFVGVGTVAPRVVGAGDAGDVVVGQLAVGAVHHPAQLAGVDEQDLVLYPSAIGLAIQWIGSALALTRTSDVRRESAYEPTA